MQLETKKTSIILSLSDVFSLLKKIRAYLFLGGICAAVITFLFLLVRPIHYSAKGILDNHTSQRTILSKAMQFFSDESKYDSAEDQRALLRSYPVLEGVVRRLNLQATITDGRSQFFQEICNKLTVESAWRQLKKNQPSSVILVPSVPTSDSLMIPDILSEISCSAIDYPSETFSSLQVVFDGENIFSVFENKKKLGKGVLEQPFYWKKGSFTLSGKGKKGKKYRLDLIPLYAAVESLKKSINVSKNVNNTSFTEISYTHRNRMLAAQIVNETMRQFQEYIQNEGKKKIDQQLNYLHMRQEEALQQLEIVLSEHKKNLESDLDANAIITLDHEIQFIAAKQNSKREDLLQISSELETLSRMLYSPPLSLDPLMAFLKDSRDQQILQTQTAEGAKDALYKYQQQLDQLLLEEERYDDCLLKLQEPEFDSSALSKILNDETLSSRFEKMQELHHHLLDEKNWTEREREQLRAKLDTEKIFFIHHIQQLKKGSQVHVALLNNKIRSLQQNLLYLLYDRFLQAENALKMLSQQASHLPQKWLTSKKIELNTRMYTDMVESITKIIETKNIGFHLEHSSAVILQPSIPPVMPNHPYLLFGTLLGGAVGIFCAFLGVCSYLVWRGPSASYANLLSYGRKVVPYRESIARLGHSINGKVAVWAAQSPALPVASLSTWLQLTGETVFVLDLHTYPEWIDAPDKSAFISSRRFAEIIFELKANYSKVLIISRSHPQSVEMQLLVPMADTLIYGVRDELLADIEQLPPHTLFFILQTPLHPARNTHSLLAELERIKISSSSFWKGQLEKLFPSKKI